jgi:prophage tail gpP-like protein
MAFHHEITLLLRSTGTKIDVWDGYAIVLDITKAGNPWTFRFWHSSSDQRTAWETLKREVKIGDQVVLAIDRACQLNGPIKARHIGGNREGAYMEISGTDVAGNAIDWDADPKIALRGVPLEEAFEKLLEPLGIPLVIGANADAAREIPSRQRPGSRGQSSTRTRRRHRIDYSHPRPGEHVWQVMESIAKRLGYMLWVAPSASGELAIVIDAPNYEQEPAYSFVRRIRNGVATPESNILDGALNEDIRSVPTTVYGIAYSPRGDEQPARIRVPYVNEELARFPSVLNPLPVQPRYLHGSQAKTPAQARQSASRMMSDAMAQWRTYDCTVQGHGQPIKGETRLYALNTMCKVYDNIPSIDEEMLIQRIEFKGSRSAGQTTHLTLGTKGSIVLDPEAEQ